MQVYPPWSYDLDLVNTWDEEILEHNYMNKQTASVEVPPGFKLELYDQDLYMGSSYVVFGRMRDDLEGVYCHIIDPAFQYKTSSLRLYRDE